MWKLIEKNASPEKAKTLLLSIIFSHDFIMCSFKEDEENIINIFPLQYFAELPDATLANVKNLNLYKNESN